MAFNGKVALVTGSSSGIGAAIAIEFTKEGAQVIIVGRNTAKLEKVSTDCAANGKRPLIIQADVSKEDQVKAIVSKTVDAFGTIDILVNNAGILSSGTLLEGNLLQSYDVIMATNLRPIIQLTTLATPHIVKSKGNIINISSVAGITSAIDVTMTAYCMSKAALSHFTRCAATELAPHGVRVNTVSPGPVVTEILENSYFGTTWETYQKQTALNRCSDSVEIADLVLFLASDKARGITGSDYISDNGMLLKK